MQNDTRLQTQFKLWKQNLSVPMTDQLREKAERKLGKIEEERFEKENEDQAFFRKKNDGEALYDIEGQQKRNDRHQAILRQTFA